MADEVKQTHFKYAVKSEGFNIWLQGKHLHAKTGVLTLNEKQNEELKELIASGRFDISTELTYLDEKGAEAVAKNVLANMKAVAHQGSSHSQSNAERTNGPVVPVKGKEPEGLTLQERIRASAQNVLASAKEESVSHGEDKSLAEMGNANNTQH